MTAVVGLMLWSLITLVKNMFPLGLSMRALDGVGCKERADFVVW